MSNERILVICVDRDDDLGRKAGIKGPVIGVDENVSSASKLLLADPGEADANSMFAAVKLKNDLESKKADVEVVTLTGDKNRGFKADKTIRLQLKSVLEDFPADSAVFVTDGADDDNLLPIIQGYLPVSHKHTVRVKQAIELERTYFVVKEAIKDPSIGGVLLGLPGIILLLYAVLGVSSLNLMLGILGVYLILKGFGIENWAIQNIKDFISGVSMQRLSFPFYIATIIFFLFFLIAAIGTYLNESGELIAKQLSLTILNSVSFLALSGLSFIIGRIADIPALNLAHNLKKYALSLVAVLIAWFVVTSAVNTALRTEPVSSFVLTIVLGVVALAITNEVSKVFDLRLKEKESEPGTPVYDLNGKRLGEIAKYKDKEKQVVIKPLKGKSYEVDLKELSPRLEGVVKLT